MSAATDNAACLKVLLVTRNLPPLVGGMERLNWHMADELGRRAELRIIGPAGSGVLAPQGVRVREVLLRPLWKFLLLASWQTIRQARRWRPDVVLAGSGLTALPCWIAARLAGTKVISYVHGLDIAVRHPIYRMLWHPALRHMDRVIANSRPTAALAQSVGVTASRIGIVHPGVALPEQLASPEQLARFRAAHQIGERPLLVSVGRLTERKGLREFVTHALPRIVAAIPDLLLLIVGDAPSDALHAGVQRRGSIIEAARRAGVERNIQFLGVITDYSQLGLAYAAARAHVFPVRELPGDPEGFGMVAIEAAAHGLPTVAFATGGVLDAVADGESGYLVPPGDYTRLADALVRLVTATESPARQCAAFGECFAWPLFGERISAELRSVVERRDHK